MNDIVDEIKSRLDNSLADVDFEIKEETPVEHDYAYFEDIKLKDAPTLIIDQEENNTLPVVDEYTGEIRRFRSPYALGSYTKAEICTQESETDSKMYEPLETTIEKCSRGPALRAFMKNNEAMFMDGSENPDIDKDFDETLRPGYDIVDAAETMTQIGDNLAQSTMTTSEAKPSEAKEETKPSGDNLAE